jgi:3-isopropylmalate dehydratase small subunit
VRALMEDAQAGKELEIDLPNQRVVRASGEAIPFEVRAGRAPRVQGGDGGGEEDVGMGDWKGVASGEAGQFPSESRCAH